MASGRDNRAGKGKSSTNKKMDPPTTKQRMPTSGSTIPAASPTVSSGTSAANVATAIGAVAKTLVSNNASNVQPTPHMPVKRPHEGSTLPNVSRAKTSEPVMVIKENYPTNQESEPSNSDKADEESDGFESLFAAYRPVDETNAAFPRFSETLSGGPKSAGIKTSSTATTTSKRASEASKSTAAPFNTVGMPHTTTAAITTSGASRRLFAGPSPFSVPSTTTSGDFKPVTTSKGSRSIFAGPSPFGVPSATTINSNIAGTPPKSLFSMSNSSQTKPLYGVPSGMGNSYAVPNTSESSTLPIDFGTAPIPNPTTVCPFGSAKVPDTVATATVMAKSPFSEFKLPNTGPFGAVNTSATNSPFFKIPDSALMPQPTTNSPFATQSKSKPFSFSSIGSLAPPFTATDFDSVVTQTTSEIKFDKLEDLVIYQKSVIEGLQSNMAWLKEQNGIVSRSVVVMTDNLEICGKQVEYFSSRCNDLNDLCKERRQENKKLQEELDKVNTMNQIGKEKANWALEVLKMKKDASQSNFTICLRILVCILFTWFAISIIYIASF